MNPPSDKKLKAAVYDPSYRRADTNSYWQWMNGPQGKEWDRAAECVNQGWPTICDLNKDEARWYGFLSAEGDEFWVYRVYAAGKDRFGRDGRYFFVLIQLESVEQVLASGVAGLFRYFETECGLPLRTDPLDEGWDGAAPDKFLKSIDEELRRGRTAGHWGIDDGLQISIFLERNPFLPEPPKVKTDRSSIQEATSAANPPLFVGQSPVIARVFGMLQTLLGYWKRYAKTCTVGAIVLLVILLGSSFCQKADRKNGGNADGPSKKNPLPPSQEDPPTNMERHTDSEASRGGNKTPTGDAEKVSEGLPHDGETKKLNRPQNKP